MKLKLLLCVLFVFAQIILFAQSANFGKLIGKWEAVDADNQSGGIEIVDSSKFFLFTVQKKNAYLLIRQIF